MSDEFYIKRCLDLAIQGIGKVSPNPMVGCVIVLNDKIIGEGYHQKYGGPHAEPNAVNDVIKRFGPEAESLLKQATVYVNLEPCAHFGKTPPCADLLVKHRVKKVVIGNRDPFDGVNGKGIAKLTAAGIEVKSGILDKECYFLNRRFFTRIQKKRPYIILKWAQTQNGFFAPGNNQKKWISGDIAKRLSHQWRSEEDAILIGKNTAIADQPELSTRLWSGKNPVKVLIDKDLAVTPENPIFNPTAKTIVLNELKTDVTNHIHYIQMEDMQFYLAQKIAFQLYLMDVQSVIIEGGANILTQFIAAQLWDEARVFTAPITWPGGLPAPVLNSTASFKTTAGVDTLSIYINDIII